MIERANASKLTMIAVDMIASLRKMNVQNR